MIWYLQNAIAKSFWGWGRGAVTQIPFSCLAKGLEWKVFFLGGGGGGGEGCGWMCMIRSQFHCTPEWEKPHRRVRSSISSRGVGSVFYPKAATEQLWMWKGAPSNVGGRLYSVHPISPAFTPQAPKCGDLSVNAKESYQSIVTAKWLWFWQCERGIGLIPSERRKNIDLQFVSWEPEGCYHYSKMFQMLRTRRALSLYKVHGDSALVVLNGTSLNSEQIVLFHPIVAVKEVFRRACKRPCHLPPWVHKRHGIHSPYFCALRKQSHGWAGDEIEITSSHKEHGEINWSSSDNYAYMVDRAWCMFTLAICCVCGCVFCHKDNFSTLFVVWLGDSVVIGPPRWIRIVWRAGSYQVKKYEWMIQDFNACHSGTSVNTQESS